MFVTLQASALQYLVRGLHHFASTDKMLPLLAGMRLEVMDGDLVAVTTDRFIAGRRRVEAEAWCVEPFGVTVPAKEFEAFARKIGKDQLHSEIRLEVEGGRLAVVMDGTLMQTFQIMDGDYPRVDRLFETALTKADQADVAAAPLGVSGANLAKIAKLTGKGNPNVQFLIPKAVGASVLFHAADVLGLVMPLRQGEDGRNVILDQMRELFG